MSTEVGPACVTVLVAACRGHALLVHSGQTITVTNPHGTQVGDFWAFNSQDLDEYFSMPHTRGAVRRLNPCVGDVLVTNRRRPILEFIGDSSPGIHDTLVAACDAARYQDLGYAGYHKNCADNLREALTVLGLHTALVPQPLNLWMNIPVDGRGGLDFRRTVAKPGDWVSFRSLMSSVIVLSACPMDLNDINGGTQRELHLAVSR
jgi:uncharacterized protein YcgI (DUF1989 family)